MEFLIKIKIRSTNYIPPFGRDVKLSAPCRNILRHVKNTCSMKVILVGNFTDISHFILLRYKMSAGYCQRAVGGRIRNDYHSYCEA
jgi:hypothetical protein